MLCEELTTAILADSLLDTDLHPGKRKKQAPSNPPQSITLDRSRATPLYPPSDSLPDSSNSNGGRQSSQAAPEADISSTRRQQKGYRVKLRLAQGAVKTPSSNITMEASDQPDGSPDPAHAHVATSQHPSDTRMLWSDQQGGPSEIVLAQHAAGKDSSDTLMTGANQLDTAAWPFLTPAEGREIVADAQRKASLRCSRKRGSDVMLNGSNQQDALAWQPSDSRQMRNTVQQPDGATAAGTSSPQHSTLHGASRSITPFKSSEAPLSERDVKNIAAGVDEATNAYGREYKERYLAVASQTIQAAKLKRRCLIRSTTPASLSNRARERTAAEAEQEDTIHAYLKHMVPADISHRRQDHESASLTPPSKPNEAMPTSAWGPAGIELQQQSSAEGVLPAEMNEVNEAGRSLVMMSSGGRTGLGNAADEAQQGPVGTQGGGAHTPGQSRGLKRHGLQDEEKHGAEHGAK